MTVAVAVVGTGSIGVAFALVFARSGTMVRCWDPVPGSADRAKDELIARLQRLEAHGLVEAVDEVVALVSFQTDLDAAVEGAAFVQECAPERLDVKRELYRQLSDFTSNETVLASSSSAMTASTIAEGLDAADRVLVGHPANPPYLLPVVEVVPSPLTRADVTERAIELYVSAGLHPVRLQQEIDGFVFNRLQGAVLREAFCLVRDGVATVADIDAIVRLGLGRRWGVVGPFETVDLNTRGGIEVHAQRMGPAYARMGQQRGQNDPWTPDLVAEVARQRRVALPLEDWDERVLWRDERLMEVGTLEHEVESR
jgi:3-hydroxyacyl-CoA dehydrogenase